MRYIAQSNYLFSRNINFSFDISSVTTFWKDCVNIRYAVRTVRNYDNIPSHSLVVVITNDWRTTTK